MTYPINTRTVALVHQAFDPVASPVGSDLLLALLESPTDLRVVLAGHVACAGHIPAGSVDFVISVIDEFFGWIGANSILEVNEIGWATFIATGSYERALACQILHQLLDLLGTPSPIAAPLPNPRVVVLEQFPNPGDVRLGRGGKETRPMTDLEVGTLRLASLPQVKGTTTLPVKAPPTTASKRTTSTAKLHRVARRDEFVRAVIVGGTESLMTASGLAGLHHGHMGLDINDHITVPDSSVDGSVAKLSLDAWTTHRMRELITHDDERECSFHNAMLYGGRGEPWSVSATNTMNAVVAHALARSGLARGGLTSASLRLWGAIQARDNGESDITLARRLGLLTNRRPDPTKLTDALGDAIAVDELLPALVDRG